MTLQELFAYLSQAQQSPNYAPNQVAGQGILGQGLKNQAAQIEAATGGNGATNAPMLPQQPQGGLLGTAPAQQSVSQPPLQNDAAKQAIIAQVLASKDPVRIAQLKHMGWI